MSKYEGTREKELTKKEKVNRFLYKCGVLWQNELVEEPPDIKNILSELQNEIKFDLVTAVVHSEQYGIDRKLDAISSVLEIDIEDMPTVRRRMMDKISHDATMNVWDYILRIARRDDWEDYTYEGYQDLEFGELLTKDLEEK